MNRLNIDYDIPDSLKLIENRKAYKQSIFNDYTIWKNLLINSYKFNRITFIGMAGCGKTYTGKLLADHIGWHWIDTDDLIIDKYKL